jgi:hypothetical protein
VEIAAMSFANPNLHTRAPPPRLTMLPRDAFRDVTFSLETMRASADLILAVYMHSDADHPVPLPTGLTFIDTIYLKQEQSRRSLVGIVVKADAADALVIVFRGTATPYEYQRYGLDTCPRREGKYRGCSNGFVNAMAGLTTGSGTAPSNYLAEGRVFVAGYSLGGAIATLFVAEAPARVILYTFGSPRVLSVELRDVLQHTLHAYRVFNENDPIPSVPAASVYKSFYAHVGMPVIFGFSGTTATDNHFFYMRELLSLSMRPLFIR